MDEVGKDFEELIERSSLGAPGARRLRQRASRAQLDDVLRRVRIADLCPTLTRVCLLSAIDDGKVTEDWYTDEPGEIWHNEYPGRRTKVTKKVREMKAVGWCRTDIADDDLHVRGIMLTPAGREVLAQHEEETTR